MMNIILIIGLILLGLTFKVTMANAKENVMSTNTDSIQTIFDFNEEKDLTIWNVVNDNVMGGKSNGDVKLTKDSCLSFTGSISFENNGGFSSIRTLPINNDLEAYEGIRIRVKGDGRTYQFRLRTDRNFDGIAFKQEFRTILNKWIEIDLPFDSFLPTYRGKILQDEVPLIAAEIMQMGFLIGDKKEGPFSLTVDEIRAYQ